jgi:MraZ protein
VYGTSETLNIDGEGRVVLSDALKTHAEIRDTATFVGLGHKFQIWEPVRFRAQLAEATAQVRALRKRLDSERAAEGAPGARE